MSDGVFWSELRAWLEEHGVNINECADVTVSWTPHSVHGGGDYNGPVSMEVTEFETNEQGRRFMRDGEVAATHRMVPMRRLPIVEVVRYREESG
jgi:hypothetical protein